MEGERDGMGLENEGEKSDYEGKGQEIMPPLESIQGFRLFGLCVHCF